MKEYTHIFWDCLRIKEFWKFVIKEIENILSVPVPLDSWLLAVSTQVQLFLLFFFCQTQNLQQ